MAGEPAMVEAGLILVSAGGGFWMVKLRATEVPPPGAGLNSVTLAVPAVAISATLIVAVRRVGLRKVVARATPFQRNTVPATKLVPSTTSVKVAPPAVVVAGLRLVIAGTR